MLPIMEDYLTEILILLLDQHHRLNEKLKYQLWEFSYTVPQN